VNEAHTDSRLAAKNGHRRKYGGEANNMKTKTDDTEFG